jgi:biofilm PGA synthesis protein PgaA
MSLKYEQKNRMQRSRQAKTALFVFLALYGIGGTALGQSAIQSVTDAASLLAMARKERAAGHRIEALTYTQDVLARWPDNLEVRELNIQILSELGAAARAKELAANLPDAAQKMRLTADYDAHQVRWARGEPVNPHRPYDEADKAAADIGKLANDPNAPADIRERARMDLLAVLDQADRAEEVLANYAPMKKRDEQLPAYAEEAVADAMMQEHDARDAIPLYEDSIRRDPGPYDPSQTDPRIGLAYAYLAAGRAHDALKTIDDLNQREPKWRHPRDVKGAKENQRKVDADTNAASIEQDAGYLQDSYNHLAALSAESPRERRHSPPTSDGRACAWLAAPRDGNIENCRHLRRA